MIRILLILVLVPFACMSSELSVQDQVRAQKLYDQVRCPTCVAQSVKESGTRTSKEIRKFINEKIQLGNSDDEIIAELERYYGNQISFKPKLNFYTFMLWGVPLLFLVLALVLTFKRNYKRNN
ncbi:MAG: putative cytochrome c-type biosis protein CcmH [Candidatus Midichloriaceae bacterium]|nr:putative cytochrome c-type biosis protein CcmH [Candidatus Midichloriaceae bacterium]